MVIQAMELAMAFLRIMLMDKVKQIAVLHQMPVEVLVSLFTTMVYQANAILLRTLLTLTQSLMPQLQMRQRVRLLVQLRQMVQPR